MSGKMPLPGVPVRIAARRLGVSRNTLDRWAELGVIAYIRVGRFVRVSEEEIARVAAAMQSTREADEKE